MKKLTFRGLMIAATCFSGVFTAFAVLGHAIHPTEWLLSTAIAFGTTFYHFAMRLVVGYLIPDTFDPNRRWFQPKAFESHLYKALKVKKWKDRMPTFDPQEFSMDKNAPEVIISNMCKAEIVHEVIIILSFVPLLFSLIWHSFFVFLITSVLGAAADAVFVIMQRCNRPRMVQLMNKQKSRRISHEETKC